MLQEVYYSRNTMSMIVPLTPEICDPRAALSGAVLVCLCGPLNSCEIARPSEAMYLRLWLDTTTDGDGIGARQAASPLRVSSLAGAHDNARRL